MHSWKIIVIVVHSLRYSKAHCHFQSCIYDRSSTAACNKPHISKKALALWVRVPWKWNIGPGKVIHYILTISILSRSHLLCYGDLLPLCIRDLFMQTLHLCYSVSQCAKGQSATNSLPFVWEIEMSEENFYFLNPAFPHSDLITNSTEREACINNS